MKVVHPITKKELERPAMFLDKESGIIKLGEWEMVERAFNDYFDSLKVTMKNAQDKTINFSGLVFNPKQTLKEIVSSLRVIALPQDQELIDKLCGTHDYFKSISFKEEYPGLYKEIYI